MTVEVPPAPTRPAEDLWRWVNKLTEPQRHRLEREHGGHEWLVLPSLIDQLEDDLGETGTGSTGRSKPGSRPPLNVNVLSLLGAMSEVIREAVVNEGLTKRPDLAGNLRQLTLHLVADLADAPDDLAWWVRIVKGWVGEAEACLPNGDDGPATRPIRKFACPDCESWTVQRIADGETFRDPAVVLVFRDGYVRYALCRCCGANWFRGDALAGLTTALAEYGLKRIA